MLYRSVSYYQVNFLPSLSHCIIYNSYIIGPHFQKFYLNLYTIFRNVSGSLIVAIVTFLLSEPSVCTLCQNVVKYGAVLGVKKILNKKSITRTLYLRFSTNAFAVKVPGFLLRFKTVSNQ